MRPRLLLPFTQAGSSQLLAVAALLHELPFKSLDLAIKQVIRLVNEADDRIGDDLGVFVREPGAVGIGWIRLISPILPILPYQPHRHGLR